MLPQGWSCLNGSIKTWSFFESLDSSWISQCPQSFNTFKLNRWIDPFEPPLKKVNPNSTAATRNLSPWVHMLQGSSKMLLVTATVVIHSKRQASWIQSLAPWPRCPCWRFCACHATISWAGGKPGHPRCCLPGRWLGNDHARMFGSLRMRQYLFEYCELWLGVEEVLYVDAMQ